MGVKARCFLTIIFCFVRTTSSNSLLEGTLNALKNEAISTLQFYHKLNEHYTEMLRDPDGFIKHNLILPQLNNSANQDEQEKYEIIKPIQRRQGVPAELMEGIGFLPLLGDAGLLPFQIAGLAMGITLFALNIGNRVDAPRLAELRQEQLDTLAALAGVPLTVVAPPESTLMDAATAARAEIDSGSNESEEYHILKKSGLSGVAQRRRCVRGKARSMGTVENFIDNWESMGGNNQVAILVGLAAFWTVGAWSMDYFGTDTTLALGLAWIVLLYLSPFWGNRFTYKDYNQFYHHKRLGELYCSGELDELVDLVQKSIEKRYK